MFFFNFQCYIWEWPGEEATYNDIVHIICVPLNNVTDFICEKSSVQIPVDILVLQAVLGRKWIHACTDRNDRLQITLLTQPMAVLGQYHAEVREI